jgi:hypothetical protein
VCKRKESLLKGCTKLSGFKFLSVQEECFERLREVEKPKEITPEPAVAENK